MRYSQKRSNRSFHLSLVHLIVLLVFLVLLALVKMNEAKAYNESGQIRADILLIKDDGSPAVLRFIKRAQRRQHSRDLFVEVFKAMKRGELTRLSGCVSVQVRLSGAHFSSGQVFKEHRYPNSNYVPRPVSTRRVSYGRNGFTIQGCHGYASVEMPYGLFGPRTRSFIRVVGRETSFPRPSYKNVLPTPAGEWQRAVDRSWQWMGFVIFVRPRERR